MNITELKNKIYDHNVPERWYSLDEGLKPGAYIIYKNYSRWEFFYLDEKGNRNEYTAFDNADAAYDYLWKKIERQLAIFKIAPRTTDQNGKNQ